MTASYLSDALADLLTALADLRDGAWSARVSWDEEPGEALPLGRPKRLETEH